MKPQAWRLKLAATKLNKGAVIAYPTEGVWGLGCLPEYEASVKRILQLKNRSWKHGLILVGSDIDMLLPYAANLSDREMKILRSSWPGAVTFLVQKSSQVTGLVSGDSDKVALRVSDHAVVSGLCRYVGGPIISTSANLSGRPAATSQLRLRQYFPRGIDYIFPGELGGNEGASEIRDLHTGEVLRAARA